VDKDKRHSTLFLEETMTRKKRTYTDEFKRDAVNLWQTSDKSAATVENELGITHGLLNKWKAQLKSQGEDAFPGRGHLTPEQEKIRQLERKLQIAEQERDILKKAVAIFSSPKS
jgi:transposase